VKTFGTLIWQGKKKKEKVECRNVWKCHQPKTGAVGKKFQGGGEKTHRWGVETNEGGGGPKKKKKKKKNTRLLTREPLKGDALVTR